MRYLLAGTLALLIAGVSLADLKVRSEKTYQPHEPIVLKAEDVTSSKAQFLWDVSAGAKVVEAGGTLYVWAPPGSYTVSLIAVDFDSKKIERTRTSFTVAGKPPEPPTPPVPPGPVPPTPGPVPIPGDGLRVLILYESADLSKMPASQQQILYGAALRAYLNSACTVGPDGKTREWRIYDKDTDVSAESKTWQAAMEYAKKEPKLQAPWLLVSNGVTGYSGPLPATATATEELVKKYVPLKKAG